MTKDFAIKTGQYLLHFGEPVIVTWAFIPEITNPAFYQAGFAIFVPETHYFQLYPGRMEIVPGVSAHVIPSVPELLEGLDNQAANHLERYVQNANKELHMARFSDRPYKIIETSFDPLMEFRLNGMFDMEILLLYQRTECSSLKQHLLKIMSTPRRLLPDTNRQNNQALAAGTASVPERSEPGGGVAMSSRSREAGGARYPRG
jgi:hypothetical protein